jgi:1-deoxy-D-xylulose-5-phosphate reductoisomerase
MRRVSVFGATGSVGESTLDLVARDPSLEVAVLTGGRNIARLAELARRHRADHAVTAFEDLLPDLRAALAGTGTQVSGGTQALLDAARVPADWIMSGIIGAAGLAPGMVALEQGTVLALANKESLVCAGPLFMATARKHGATVIPVDSEHSAVFQALVGEDPARIERVILTASGGGLRDMPMDQLPHATLAQAGAHPNWDMGQRITIDSASMFNKAMEVIEAREFFGLPPEKIEVLIHPQSIVHALVGFADGALMAHLGAPDMRHPIGYALYWPDRTALPVQRLDLAKIGRLNFDTPDPARYPALKLAWDVMRAGGGAGAVFNAAKESALDAFIGGAIRFTDMAPLVARVLDHMAPQSGPGKDQMSLQEVLDLDAQARVQARAFVAAGVRMG